MRKFPKVVLEENTKSHIEKYEQFLDFLAGEMMTLALLDSVRAERKQFVELIETKLFPLSCEYPKSKFEWECYVECMNLLMRTDLYIQQFNEKDQYAKATLTATDRGLFNRWKDFKGIKND